MTRIWEDLLSDLDRAIYREAGWGARGRGGQIPALLVIDVTYEFVGDKPEPILDSIKKFPNSCGEVGWRGMAVIRELLDLSRELHIPIFYTKGLDEASPITRGSWAWKKTGTAEQKALDQNRIANQIPLSSLRQGRW